MIAAPARPALVVAGAGAGKTETMAARVVWLVATGAGAPRAGPRPDVHPQGRPAARGAGPVAAAQARGLPAARRARPQRGAARRGARRRADRRHLPRLRRPAGRRARPAAARRARGPAARRDGVLAARPPGGQHLGGRPGRRRAARHRHRPTLLALAGELGEHLVEPAAVRAHAAAAGRGCSRPRRAGQGQRAEPSQTLPAVDRDAAHAGARCCRWWRRSSRRKRAERALDFADQLAIAARVADEHPEVGAHGAGHLPRRAARRVPGHRARPARAAARAVRRRARAIRCARTTPTVTAVGDPCQSIYGWRGASAGNLARFRTDFPRPPTAPRRRVRPAHELPQPAGGARGWPTPRPRRCAAAPGAVGVGGAARPGRAPGARRRPGARCCRTSRRTTCDWAAPTSIAASLDGRRGASSRREGRRPRRPCWCAAASTWTPIAAALRARGLPVEVVGLGGLLDTPEVRDLVSALRLVADPLAGPAAVRLLTGAALAAGRRRPRRALGAGPRARAGRRRPDAAPHPRRARARRAARRAGRAGRPRRRARRPGPGRALLARRASPGSAGSRAELGRLRARASAPLTDLVADAERVLLLDAETAARPGPVGRAHLDAFADVVADFAAGRRGRDAARAARLPRHRRAGRGRALARRGRGRARPRPGPHRARREGPGVGGRGRAAPGGARCSPAARSAARWLTRPGRAARPAARRRPRPPRARPARRRRPQVPMRGTPSDGARRGPGRRGGWSRSGGCSTWRSPGPSACCCSPGTGGPRPARSRRQPSEFLSECATSATTGMGRASTGPTSPSRRASTRPPRSSAPPQWPVDPLGARAADVHAGAELVRAALRARIDAATPAADRPRRPDSRCSTSSRPPEPDEDDPEGWAADVDVLLAERAAARERARRRAARAAVGEQARRARRRSRRARRAAASPAAAAPEPARPPRHRVPRLAGAAVRRRAAARPRRAARRRRRGRRLGRRARRSCRRRSWRREWAERDPSRWRCRSRP